MPYATAKRITLGLIALLLAAYTCANAAIPEGDESDITPTRAVESEATEAPAMPTGTRPPASPTAEPDEAEADAPEREDVSATETAAAFDAAATQYAATDLGPAANVARRELNVDVQDLSGERLGDGQVRVYAPEEMDIEESSEVRVEIVVDEVAESGGTLVPRPTNTPALGTPQPTPTPLPLEEIQFVEVHEYMGAELRGVDADLFRIDAVPPTGIRRIHPNAINWWKWTLRPVGPEAAGTRHLEVVIFLEQRRSDGQFLPQETNVIPITIEVTGGGLFNQRVGMLGLISGVVITLAGAAGAFYGARRVSSLRKRLRAQQQLEHEPASDDDQFDVDISGDMDGSLSVAGDDIITYQTVIQQMPTTLIIVLITALTALVVGMAVILIVLVP